MRFSINFFRAFLELLRKSFRIWAGISLLISLYRLLLPIIVALLGILFTGLIVALARKAAKLSIRKIGSIDEVRESAQERMNQRHGDRYRTHKLGEHNEKLTTFLERWKYERNDSQLCGFGDRSQSVHIRAS